MTTPHRVSIKFWAANATAFDLSVLVPIFQRWIQERSVEGLLIDAADYKHVESGPGIMLIGHDGDYSFDGTGLLYVRKRDVPESWTEIVNLVFRLGVAATQLLATDPALNGLSFDYSTVELSLLDRLNYPNTPDNVATFQVAVRGFLVDLYQTEDISITAAHADPREPLGLTIQVPAGVTVDDLLIRLGAVVA